MAGWNEKALGILRLGQRGLKPAMHYYQNKVTMGMFPVMAQWALFFLLGTVIVCLVMLKHELSFMTFPLLVFFFVLLFFLSNGVC